MCGDRLGAPRGTTTATTLTCLRVLAGFGGRPLGRRRCVRVQVLPLGGWVFGVLDELPEPRVGGVRVVPGRVGGWQCSVSYVVAVVADVCRCRRGWACELACRVIDTLLGVR